MNVRFNLVGCFSCLFLFILSIGVVTGQEVNLSEQNAKLSVVLAKIRQQTGLDLVGDMKLVSEAGPVTIQANRAPIEQVLEELSRQQSFALFLSENTIVIKRAENRSGRSGGRSSIYLITGIVSNVHGEPLPGASVNIQGLEKGGTSTNANGRYTLQTDGVGQLIVQLLGYKRVSIPLEGQHHLDVRLESGVEDMDEVVVTGYFSRKKESFTGASTTITRAELEKFNNNNIFSIIQTLDPAFRIKADNNAGSNPNVIPEITIRGAGSIGAYAVNAPLVILDGFEVSLERLYDLDINRIESISLLKDASATILYGSRGGNGVVVIETRLPKGGKFTVTYEAKPSITLVDLADYNLMNARQKLDYEKLAGVYRYNDPNTTDPRWIAHYQQALDNLYASREINVLSGVDTYWLSQPVSSPISVAHSIRVEGGNEEVRYSIDGNYNDVKGAMKNSGRRRSGAGFNLIYRIPNKITFRNNASFISTHVYNSPYGSFSAYTLLNPYEKIYDDNGALINEYNQLGEFSDPALGNSARYNPLYNASLPFKDFSDATSISNNLSIDWTINPAIRLIATGIIQKDFTDAEIYKSPFNTDFLEESELSRKGSYFIANGSGIQYQGNLNLQFNKALEKHLFIANLIGELRSQNTQNTSHLLTGFVDDRFVSPSLALQYAQDQLPVYTNVPERLIGLIGSFNYSYDSKYNADFSYRVDGSSKFGRDNPYGRFWSVGLGYNIHRESFLNDGPFSLLRLFANIGENGSENFSADMVSTGYNFEAGNRYYNQYAANYINQGNSALLWPKIRQLSMGIQSRFLQDKASVSFNYYDKVTNRMISNITVAPSLGFAGNTLFQNLGSVHNRGFEFAGSFQVINNQATGSSLTLRVAGIHNVSKLKNISNELRLLNESLLISDEDGRVLTPSVYYEEGQSLTILRAVPSLGIDPASGREIYEDRFGQPTYTWDAKDQRVVGDTSPKMEGTFGAEYGFKGLSVQALFSYTMGGDVYNSTLVEKIENVSPYTNADLRVLQERWKQPGDIALYKAIDDQTPTQLTSRFVQEENYLRFSSLNINYDFNTAWIKNFKLQRLRLNFSTNDVFRWSTVKMERGIDYPFARTYNMGLLVQF